MHIRQLIYISTSTVQPDETYKHVRPIMAAATERNASLRITGALTCVSGKFFQVIERPSASVTTLFDRICRDSRHFDVVVLSDKPIPNREFSDWTMLFANAPAGDMFFANQLLSHLHAENPAALPSMMFLLQKWARLDASQTPARSLNTSLGPVHAQTA